MDRSTREAASRYAFSAENMATIPTAPTTPDAPGRILPAASATGAGEAASAPAPTEPISARFRTR